MKMFKADGTYWATLTSPDPGPDVIGIGPWVFVLDKSTGNYKEDPTLEVTEHNHNKGIYVGPISYHTRDDGTHDSY